ncbi:MAG: biopolymer transporter ExbD [Bacteroidetes bacterium]|nr:biopolymer transporter ExbD [Bacteroidota bacterium]
MKEDRSDLMVFIDLGFILLVGFLLVSDTTQKENVALPSEKEEEQQNPTEIGVTYEVQFNAILDFLVLNLREQVVICSASGVEEFTSCILPLTDSAPKPVLVLSPYGRASVQQLVSLLDLCKRSEWRCTVDN